MTIAKFRDSMEYGLILSLLVGIYPAVNYYHANNWHWAVWVIIVPAGYILLCQAILRVALQKEVSSMDTSAPLAVTIEDAEIIPINMFLTQIMILLFAWIKIGQSALSTC
jgi:hypothetical protein